MKIGICADPKSLYEVADAGFDFVEMTCSALAPDKSDSEWGAARKSLKSAPVRVDAFNCFVTGTLKVVGPDVDPDKLGRHMDIVLRRASEVGASIMVFGSGGARNVDGEYPAERKWDQLAKAADLAGRTAARYGITIAMEPLRAKSCQYFNRVDEGAAFVDRVGHPNVRLLVDLFHFADAKEPLENIVKAGKRFAHVHLATPSIPETGEGAAYDFEGFFRALKQVGYNERVSVEDNPGLLQAKWENKDELVRAFRAIREFIAETLRRTGIQKM